MTIKSLEHKYWLITFTRVSEKGHRHHEQTEVIDQRPINWLINENKDRHEDRHREGFNKTVLNFAMPISKSEYEDVYFGRDFE